MELTNNEIIQNSDRLYKSDIVWRDDIKVEPINQYEIDMLKNTKNPIELLAQEPIEKPIKQDARRDYITKVKVIALCRCGLQPLMNGSLLSEKNKKKVINEMKKVMDMSEHDIQLEFNEVCMDDIFSSNTNYCNYPTYDI